MDALSILTAIGLACLVGVFIARPWLVHRRGQTNPAAPATELMTEHESVLLTLRELDFDHLTGKIADDDYAAQRAVLVGRGVTLLQQLDTLTETPSLSVDDQLEAEVSAARARRTQSQPAAGFCPQCGTPHHTTDRFCAKCGVSLTGAA